MATNEDVKVLIQAIWCRSWLGVRLALRPWLLGFALVVVWAVLNRVDGVGPVVTVGAVAAWAVWVSRILERRARHLTEWFRDQVSARGGLADPPQPIDAPSAKDLSEDPRPGVLRELDQNRLDWMSEPGRVGRRVLAIVGGWFPISEFVDVFLLHPASAISQISVAVLGVVALVALADLYRGRVRSARRWWTTQDGTWPEPWVVRWRRSRVPGPVWSVIGLALYGAVLLVVYEPSIERASALAALIGCLWSGRRRADRLARLEETVLHQRFARALVAAVPAAWWLGAVLQFLLFGIGMVGMWAALYAPELAPVGIMYLMLGSLVWIGRAAWRRPRDPLIVNSREVQLAFAGTALEKRLSGRLWALALAAAVLTFVSAI